ncbi:MAG TPA: DUF992 domain-containing protein [Caulobacteraceae bacterium]|jgi:hypothetical protein|nr:DUF992 domain-containing protein [Caulobacteraceae bacterium]
MTCSDLLSETRRKAGFRTTSALLSGAALLLASFAAAGPASAADAGVQVGVLSCNQAAGWGFIFGSSKEVQCTFSAGDHVEHYRGHINKFGVDIGYQAAGVIVWAVFAPTGTVNAGALEGNYGGATASAAVGVGAGANVLIGGSGNTISLQPVSISGATGLNVAGGIASLTLKAAPGT